MATALTCEHLSYYDAYSSVVKGMFQQRIYRSLGLAAHLGWARLVIDRTKANIRYPTPGNSPGAADPAKTKPLRTRALPTPIAPLLLHTCKRYTCLPAIDSTAPPRGSHEKLGQGHGRPRQVRAQSQMYMPLMHDC